MARKTDRGTRPNRRDFLRAAAAATVVTPMGPLWQSSRRV